MKFGFILTLGMFLSIAAYAENDPVIATVNGKTIRKSTLLAYHQQNLNFIQNTKKVTMESSLNDLIDRIIGIEKAKQNKIHERPEVIKKMNDVVYHAFVSQELTPLLQKIKVSEIDIKKYYSSFPEYKTSQILLRLPTTPTEEEVAQALKTATQIYKESSKGGNKAKKATFEQLAVKNSQTSSAITGGDMGYQPKTRLTNEYYAAIKGQPIGFVTKPFRSQYGFHVVMVTGKKTYKQIDKKLYEKIVYDQKRDKILKKYFKGQRAKAKIKIDKKQLSL